MAAAAWPARMRWSRAMKVMEGGIDESVTRVGAITAEAEPADKSSGVGRLGAAIGVMRLCPDGSTLSSSERPSTRTSLTSSAPSFRPYRSWAACSHYVIIGQHDIFACQLRRVL